MKEGNKKARTRMGFVLTLGSIPLSLRPHKIVAVKDLRARVRAGSTTRPQRPDSVLSRQGLLDADTRLHAQTRDS